MNDTLKVAGRIGAELGAAKAENERLRGLLREAVHCCPDEQLRNEMKAALSQQAEQEFTRTVAAEIGPNAYERLLSEPAPAKDGREAFEAEWVAKGGVRPGNYSAELDRYVSERVQGRYEGWKLARATLPAQTEQQPAQDERDFNPEHTLFNEIRCSMPVNDDGEETRYIINEQQLQRIRALEFNRPAQTEQQPVTVPEGYALVPQTMHLDKGVIDALLFHVGGVDGAEEEDKYVDGILWVGEVLGDDGEREAYGLNIACAECPEEGSTNLIEFSAPIAQTAPRGDA